MGKRVGPRGQTRRPDVADAAPSTPGEARAQAASLRRAILWSAAAFLVVAIAGVLLVPGLRLVWVVTIVLGIAAVPQAFLRDR